MSLGFVMITAEHGEERDVYNALLKIKEVAEADGLIGTYSIIAKIDAKDFDDVGRIVVDCVNNIPGVIESMSLYVPQIPEMPSYYRK